MLIQATGPHQLLDEGHRPAGHARHFFAGHFDEHIVDLQRKQGRHEVLDRADRGHAVAKARAAIPNHELGDVGLDTRWCLQIHTREYDAMIRMLA